MVKTHVILRLLNNLEGYVNELRNATDITHERYIGDIRLQRFVERTLQIAIECCFDVIHHIIADKGYREPDSYADAFTVLAENGVLPDDSLAEFQVMAQFRNKIVHYYGKVRSRAGVCDFPQQPGRIRFFQAPDRGLAGSRNRIEAGDHIEVIAGKEVDCYQVACLERDRQNLLYNCDRFDFYARKP